MGDYLDDFDEDELNTYNEAGILRILDEMGRIWAPDWLCDGENESYDWLLEHYGVTPEEDNLFLDIWSRWKYGEMPDDAPEENRKIILDPKATARFIDELLEKYQGSTDTYR
jgi:hypothetical protein